MNSEGQTGAVVNDWPPAARLALAAGLAWCLGCQDLPADTFRCGQKVVRTGDSEAELLQRCGEPMERQSATEEIWLKDGLDRVRVNRWYYKLSERRLQRVVVLYKGHVVEIRTGSR